MLLYRLRAQFFSANGVLALPMLGVIKSALRYFPSGGEASTRQHQVSVLEDTRWEHWAVSIPACGKAVGQGEGKKEWGRGRTDGRKDQTRKGAGMVADAATEFHPLPRLKVLYRPPQFCNW